MSPQPMKLVYLIPALLLAGGSLSAQTESSRPSPWRITPSIGIQSDMHLSTETDPERRWSGNTYITGTLRSEYLELGARLEEMNSPFPGHEAEKGWGVPHVYLRGRYRGQELTIGDVYDQFGSGLLLRLYEDRPLGIDNAVRGAHLALTPHSGVRLKGLVGQQRRHFDRQGSLWASHRGYLWGTDIELSLDRWLSGLSQSGTTLSLGGSFVSRYERQSDITALRGGVAYRLIQPEHVGAWASRLHLQRGAWDLYAEYGYKYDDPSAVNGYTYRPGSVAMATLSYAEGGFSALVGARRSDNFDFRSAREERDLELRINHLLPFTQQQTYTLAALYPYATQAMGEWALQGELRYTIARGTPLGGRYGTQVRLSGSYIRGLRPVDVSASNQMGSDGQRMSFWGWGEKYFHDYNVEVSRKFSRAYTASLSYMNQYYNQAVIEGHADNGDVVLGHIFVYEGKHRLSRQLSLRTELQYLATRQAEGDWLYALAELSILPHFIVSLSDQYNAGTTGRHYYMASVAGTFGAHRIQLGVGRTRRGINCSGGVCRLMPATEGLYLSYNANF